MVPRVFSKVLLVVAATVHQWGISVFPYLDDVDWGESHQGPVSYDEGINLVPIARINFAGTIF